MPSATGHLLRVPLHDVERQLHQLLVGEVLLQRRRRCRRAATSVGSSARRPAPAPPVVAGKVSRSSASTAPIVSSSSPASLATARRRDIQVPQSWCLAHRMRTISVVTGSTVARRTVTRRSHRMHAAGSGRPWCRGRLVGRSMVTCLRTVGPRSRSRMRCSTTSRALTNYCTPSSPRCSRTAATVSSSTDATSIT